VRSMDRAVYNMVLFSPDSLSFAQFSAFVKGQEKASSNE
jgi:hypothetical protein